VRAKRAAADAPPAQLPVDSPAWRPTPGLVRALAELLVAIADREQAAPDVNNGREMD
jgi:hypothetical protein